MVPSSVWASDGLRRAVGVLFRRGKLGQSEIEHFDDSVRADHDVARLDVAMDDARRVGRRQRAGDGDGILQNVGHRQAATGDQLLERLAGHELHHHEVGSIRLVDLVDGDDVGVVQRRRGFGLLNEALLAGFVFQLLGAEDLDADEAVEAQIPGLVDHTHPALAELGEYFVMR